MLAEDHISDLVALLCDKAENQKADQKTIKIALKALQDCEPECFGDNLKMTLTKVLASQGLNSNLASFFAVIQYHHEDRLFAVLHKLAMLNYEKSLCGESYDKSKPQTQWLLDKALILQALVSTETKATRTLLLDSLRGLFPESEGASLLLKAEKYRTLMETRQLNYNQALAWTQPETRTWLLQFKAFRSPNVVYKTPLALSHSIVSFLLPPTLLQGKSAEKPSIGDLMSLECKLPSLKSPSCSNK